MSSRVWLPASSSLVLGPWSGAHVTRCIASPLPPLRPHCPAVMRCFVPRHQRGHWTKIQPELFFPRGKGLAGFLPYRLLFNGMAPDGRQSLKQV